METRNHGAECFDELPQAFLEECQNVLGSAFNKEYTIDESREIIINLMNMEECCQELKNKYGSA